MSGNVADQFFDYAVNAQASYGADAMNSANASAVNGWTPVRVDRFQQTSPDFSAQMYTDGQGHYRFSMRGSETSNYAGDFRTADAALMAGQWDAQLADGIRFVGEAILLIAGQSPGMRLDDIRAIMDGSGHSLGGAIYEAAAAFWGLRGMSIDGPGVAKQIESPEFQDLKEEFRARGLTELADSYEWQRGDFQARRYTVVGAAEIHVDGVDVYTSPRMEALLADMNGTPSWAYAFGAAEGYAWQTIASIAGHPMAAIFEVEGMSDVGTRLLQRGHERNVAAGLSANGYEVDTTHYETFGRPVIGGVGNSASTSRSVVQVTTYRDPVTGAIMEVRLSGRQVDGLFIASGTPALVSGLDTAGRTVFNGGAAQEIAIAQLGLSRGGAVTSGQEDTTVSDAGPWRGYDSVSIQNHADGTTSFTFQGEGGETAWVLRDGSGGRTVVLTSSSSAEGEPRTIIYNLNASGQRVGEPRYYDGQGQEVSETGIALSNPPATSDTPGDGLSSSGASGRNEHENGNPQGDQDREHIADGDDGSEAPTEGDAFYDALLDAFKNPPRPEGEGIVVADSGSGAATDAGQQQGEAGDVQGAYSFGAYLEGAGAGLSMAQQQGLANQLDGLKLGGSDALSFITLSTGSTLIQNADGEVVGEIQQGPDGRTRISATRINADGSAEPVVIYIDAQGQALSDQQLTQSRAQQTAAAIGLLNSIIGLQSWDAMSDLQRTAALAGIYNAVDRITGGGTLPGDLGTAAGVLGLLHALDRGDPGAIVYSGLSLVESLTVTTTVNAAGQTVVGAGVVTDTLGNNFLPVLGFVLAVDSGDPWAMASSGVALMTALQVIPVWGQILAAVIAVVGMLFEEDMPMREGIAHAEWDAQGQVQVVTDLDAEGGGETATRWMRGLVDGLQGQIGGSGYSVVPNLLPAIGFQYDPDGFNLRNGAKGYMVLRWTDENGDLQTRYYDGTGQRGDGSGETLAGDFMKHSASAIAPTWVVEMALAHWQQGGGLSLPDARDGLPIETVDGLRQSIKAVMLALPDEVPLRESLVDVDGDGYLELTQWVAANQQLLAIDADGDGLIGAGELLQLSGGQALNSARWLDANGDGMLDASDPAFRALRLWLDVNGDGVSTSETQTMVQAGILAIDFGSHPPAIVRADGSRQTLTSQTLTADVLGVAYQSVIGGVLQVSEQSDGRSAVLLVAENQRTFDGQVEHMHGGDVDTDGARGAVAGVNAGDGRLQGASANTLDETFARTGISLDDGDGRIRSGSAGTAQQGQGTGQRNALPGSATVRSNGIAFVPVGAQSATAELREVTDKMVRSTEATVFGGGLGPGVLTAVAVGAVANWPAVVQAEEEVTPTDPAERPSAADAGVLRSVERPTNAAQTTPSGASALLRATEGSSSADTATPAVPSRAPDAGPSLDAGVSSGAEGMLAVVRVPTALPSGASPRPVPSAPLVDTGPAAGDASGTGSTFMVDFPSVVDDHAMGLEDTGFRFTESSLLENDATQNSPPMGRHALTIVSVHAPRHGEVSLQIDPVTAQTHVVFVPQPGYHGPASFSYTVSDAYGLTRTAIVTLDVGAVNDAPHTGSESASGAEDRTLVFTSASLLANDGDPDNPADGDLLRITRVGDAQHGRVFLLDDGTVRFEPDADYHGPARFSYWVGDRDAAMIASGEGLEAQASVSLLIVAVNDAPQTQGESASGDEDRAMLFTAASLLANDSDVDTEGDGDILRITRVGAAEHGQVFLLADGSVRFEPDADYNGPARFSYWVGDRDAETVAAGLGAETQAIVSLIVNPVNDAPQTRGEMASGDEDRVLLFTAASLLANDSDVDTGLNGDVLRITRVGAAEHGQVFLLPDGTVRFEPDAEYNGPARFSYWVGDRDVAMIARGMGSETQASMALTILAVNDLPVVAGEQIDSDEDIALHIDPALLLANDSDVDVATNAQVLSIVAVGDARHGMVTLLSDGSIRFDPQPDYVGLAGFSYTVDDGQGGRAVAQAVLNLAPVNDAPVVIGESIAFDEDVIQTISSASLLANDQDGDSPHVALRIVSVDNASHGVVSMDASGAILFVPEADYFGSASFTYTVADGSGGFTVGTASLEIVAVNDAPRLIGDAVRLDEDTVATFTKAALLANDTDVDNPRSALQITGVSNAVHGAVSMTDGTIVFTPDANFNGQASFTYTVTDGAGGTSEASVTLGFTPLNDAPVANDELLWGKRDVTYHLTQAALLANDLDVESPENLRVVAIGDVQHGRAVLQADGSVTFTPDPGFAGRGSFSYVVEDPEGAQSRATAQIDFTRVNVNPTATDDSFVGFEDAAFSISAAQLLTNDSDTDNAFADLRVTATGNAVNGSASMDGDGNVTFTPTANFNGTASFQYQLSDPEGGQTWATAYLHVQSVNDAPIIEDIWYGRPIYGYQWQATGNARSPWTLAAVQDEATALALVSNPSDTIYSSVGNSTRSNDLMDAGGSAIGVSYYLNGHVRPIGFDNRDGAQPPRLGPSPVDLPIRQNGGIVAYDPDGDSNAITFSVGVTPQHGVAWTNQYVAATVLAVDHTSVTAWVAQTGAWQYYSFRGDLYTGGDPFTIFATDGQGATASATINAQHYGTSASGGGSCPIVIDLKGDGIELLRPEDSSIFADVNSDGWRERIGWAAPSDGVLVYDANADGRVDLDSEVSFVSYVPGARTDLEGLAAFDTDGDGWVTARDAQWGALGVFQDRNGNGQQDENEFASMSELGLAGIDLQRQGAPVLDQSNVVFGTTTVQWADGHVSQAADVMFAGEGVALPPAVEALFPVSQEDASVAMVERLAQLFNQAVNAASGVSDAPALAYVPIGAAGEADSEDALAHLVVAAGNAAAADSVPLTTASA